MSYRPPFRMTWPGLVDQAALAALLPEIVARLPEAYWQAQRWFGSKGQRVVGGRLVDLAPMPGVVQPSALTLVDVALAAAPTERYFLPWVVNATNAAAPIAVVETPGGSVALSEAFDAPGWCAALVGHMANGATLAGQRGAFRCTATHVLTPGVLRDTTAKRLGAEQSNTSLRLGAELICKFFRKLQPGLNPDLEVAHFLTTRTTFRHTPLLAGAMSYEAPDFEASVALVQTFVPNVGDAWAFTLGHLRELRADVAGGVSADVTAFVAQRSAHYLAAARRLGEITAALHLALASDPTTPAFAPEPIRPADAASWIATMNDEVRRVLDALRAVRVTQPPEVQAQIERLLALAPAFPARFGRLAGLPDEGVQRIRHHGDYHLGQVLRTADDFVVIDFEGEPARPVEARRAKHCALRDVAGMLRSFNYARHAALAADGTAAPDPALGVALAEWERQTAAAYLAGYRATAGRAPFLPRSAELFAATLEAFELEKALYEVWYELNNRPAWLPIPLARLAA